MIVIRGACDIRLHIGSGVVAGVRVEGVFTFLLLVDDADVAQGRPVAPSPACTTEKRNEKRGVN